MRQLVEADGLAGLRRLSLLLPAGSSTKTMSFASFPARSPVFESSIFSPFVAKDFRSSASVLSLWTVPARLAALAFGVEVGLAESAASFCGEYPLALHAGINKHISIGTDTR
jgi:hypothetical protein